MVVEFASALLSQWAVWRWEAEMEAWQGAQVAALAAADVALMPAEVGCQPEFAVTEACGEAAGASQKVLAPQTSKTRDKSIPFRRA